MKYTMHRSLMAAALLSLPLPALAELTTNIGITSNYVFRGFTQTDDSLALQGGIDYAHDSGFFIGAWASGVDSGAEVDGYLGYGGEAGSFGYEVGFITYEYTDDAFFDGAFREFYVGGSYGPASLNIYSGYDTFSNTDYIYADASAGFSLPAGFGLDFRVGMLDADGADDNVYDTGISLSRSFGGFDFALSATNEDATDDTAVFVSISRTTTH